MYSLLATASVLFIVVPSLYWLWQWYKQVSWLQCLRECTPYLAIGIVGYLGLRYAVPYVMSM